MADIEFETYVQNMTSMNLQRKTISLKLQVRRVLSLYSNQVTDHNHMNRDITKYIATQNTITEHMNR